MEREGVFGLTMGDGGGGGNFFRLFLPLTSTVAQLSSSVLLLEVFCTDKPISDDSVSSLPVVASLEIFPITAALEILPSCCKTSTSSFLP